MTRDSAAARPRSPHRLDEASAPACPNCGRAALPGDLLCRLCWQPLPDGVRAAADASGNVELARRRVSRRRAATIAALALAVAFLLAWCARPLVLRPGPLPAPSETVTLAALGPTWPTAIGDLAGRRAAALPVPDATAWQAPLPAVPVTAPVADADHVYLAFADGTLRAFDARDGAEVWRHSVPGQLDAAPAVGEQALFVGLRNGDVRALERATGDVRWESSTGVTNSAPPVLLRGVLVLVQSGRLLGLDAATGRELWSRDMPEAPVLVQPVAADGRLAVALHHHLVLLDTETGATQFEWTMTAEQGRVQSLGFAGEHLAVLTSRALAFLSVEIERPWWEPVRRAWAFAYVVGLAPDVPWRAFERVLDVRAPVPPPAFTDDLAIVAAADGVRALAIPSGTTAWEQGELRPTTGPLVLGDSVLIAEPGALHVLDVATGAPQSRVPLPPGEPRGIAPTAQAVYVVVDEELVALAPASQEE